MQTPRIVRVVIMLTAISRSAVRGPRTDRTMQPSSSGTSRNSAASSRRL